MIVEPGPEARNPFVGLRPFESEDSLYFFGRDAQSREVLAQLNRSRLVAVVGSSGSGKSSLVKASVVPSLEAGFLVQDRDAWTIATMKPGEAPLHSLARTLLQATGGAYAREEIEDFVDHMRRQGVEALRNVLRPHLQATDINLLLLVDQFEEIFRFSLDNGHGHGAEDAADVVSLMLALSEEPGLPTFVCLTMRSDYLGDCDAFAGLPEAMNRSQYLVPRLTRKERREAITGPIHLAGVEIAPRLVDRLLNENIGTRDDLPVLQHALLRTWDEWARNRSGPIDMEHYERAGTIQNALSADADEALRELSPDHQLRDDSLTSRQLLAKNLFQALTAVDAGNRRLRRPVHLRDVAESTGATPEDVRVVLERFRTAGRAFVVLSSDDPAADPLIDISHESLIRQWRRLNDWVDEEAASAKVYQRLADTAQLHDVCRAGLYRDPDLQVALEWRDGTHPTAAWARRYHPGFAEALAFLDASGVEQERERKAAAAARESRLKRLLAAMGVGLVFAASAALVVYVQQRELQDRSNELQERTTKLDTANAALAQGKVDIDRKNAELELALTDLEAQKNQLEEQKDRLQQKSDELEESNKQLASSRQTFKDTIDIGIRALDNDTAAKRQFDAFIRDNAKVFYAVDVWVFGATENSTADIGAALKAQGYTLWREPIVFSLSSEGSGWIAPSSTVFYYDKYSQPAAAAIGTILEGVTGTRFRIARGSGLGISTERRERRWTIIVHYIAPADIPVKPPGVGGGTEKAPG